MNEVYNHRQNRIDVNSPSSNHRHNTNRRPGKIKNERIRWMLQKVETTYTQSTGSPHRPGPSKTSPRQASQGKMGQDTKPQPNRYNSGIILVAAAFTTVFAAITIWNAYHNPTLFNAGTATFVSLATAAQIAIALYTRRNEEKTAYYRDIIKRIGQNRANHDEEPRGDQQA